MESRLKHKINQLNKSVNDFNKSLKIDTTGMAPEVIDTIKSGQVQKFEIVVDLLWKTFKLFLFEINGIDVNSPKKAIKAYFQAEECTYDDYEWLIRMIDMRNKLSHIYDAEKFEKIHAEIFAANKVINRIVKNL